MFSMLFEFVRRMRETGRRIVLFLIEDQPRW